MEMMMGMGSLGVGLAEIITQRSHIGSGGGLYFRVDRIKRSTLSTGSGFSRIGRDRGMTVVGATLWWQTIW